MNLDTLAERVMRKVRCASCNGAGQWTGEADACNAPGDPCEPCHGTGTVLDPRWAALREALWEEKEVICEDETCLAGGIWEDGARRHHLHNETVRRTRAEAAYPLLLAAKPHFQAEHWRLISLEDGWTITKPVPDEHEMAEYGGFLIVAKALDPYDALSAALLAWVKAQEVKA